MSVPSHPVPHPATQVGDDCVTETRRLRIRKLTRDDLPALVDLFGNLEVMRFSSTGPLAPPQVAQILDQILESYADRPLSLWGVVEKSEQCLIGLCGFLQSDRSRPEESELAYRFLPCYWGQGLATEAARACKDLAFLSPTVQRVSALIERGNLGSRRVARKVGLSFAGVVQLDTLQVLKYGLHRNRDTHGKKRH